MQELVEFVHGDQARRVGCKDVNIKRSENQKPGCAGGDKKGVNRQPVRFLAASAQQDKRDQQEKYRQCADIGEVFVGREDAEIWAAQDENS